MAEETITILKVDTGEAVQNIGDLRSNIKTLKENLEGLTIGTEEYKQTLGELKENQNALKDAMYATTSSLEDVAKAAKGMGETYNGLVHQMATLKAELRNVDISTDEGKAKFKELAGQINEVNDKLKEMDALQGNYQRNVGNYKSAFDGFGESMKKIGPVLGSAGAGVSRLGTELSLLGKQPILGVVGIIATGLVQITKELKGNETAMASVRKGMEALKPVTDFLQGIIQKIAEGIGKAVDWFVELTKGSGDTFSKIIAGAVGVGNVLLQFVLAPIKTIIEAFKGLGNIVKDVFTGQFKKVKEDAVDAWNGIKDAFKDGFSFANNFKQGQEVGRAFLEGLGTVKKPLKEGAKAAVEAGVDEGIEAIRKGYERALKLGEEAHARMLQNLSEFEKDAADEWSALNDDIAAIMDEQGQIMLDANKKAEQMAKARVETMYAAAEGISSILGSIADAYEAEGDQSEEAANRTKALRIAAATVDTISGAIGAFMQATETIPPPFGQIVGGIEAAAITAAGAANIAKMQATKVGSSSGSSASVSFPSFPTAPATTPNIPQVRNVTGASEEQRLNNAAQPQEVYILQSSIEAAGLASQVQVAESSF